MERRQLEHFLAVIQWGSMSEAARSCGITQSALSQSVASLEKDLGVTLFRRGHRHVALTAAGHALQAPASDALAALERARDRVRAATSSGPGRLEIACAPTAVIDPLAGALAEVYGAHPGVTVTVHGPFTRGRPLEVLSAGRVEVALSYERGFVDCDVRLSRTQEMLAVLPPGTELPRAGVITLPELLAVGLVMSPPGDLLRDSLSHHVGASRVDAAVVVESAHPDPILLLVAAGAGATVLPQRHAQIAADQLGLEIRATDPVLRHSLYVAHRREPLSAAAETLVAALCRNGGPSWAAEGDEHP